MVTAEEYLLSVVEVGEISPRLKSLSDFFLDLGPGYFSWKSEDARKEVEALLQSSNFPRIQSFFEGKYEVDLRKILQAFAEEE